MTKPIMKPTRSMPKIDMEHGDSMDEGEGQEEWLSDGGYTDDDTLTSQEATSSQDEQTTQPASTNPETTTKEPSQVEETVENINNQLQLEINIGEDGVAVIRRQAVRVADQSLSPQKASPQKDPLEPPGSPSIFTEGQPAAATTSASEGTADDGEHSAEDPEKLLDQLETFLIRKTDGKVLGTKATVQTTLTDLVKNTVDDDAGDGDGEERAVKGDEDDDGNDTDDLLSVLDDSVSRRTRRSLAKLQQAETQDTTSTAKGKTSTPSKQVTKSVQPTKPSLRRSTTRSTSSSASQDDKPVILSNKVVHMSSKKSHSNQKSSLNKSDKSTSKIDKDSLLISSKTDDDLVKHFAKKTTQNSQETKKTVAKAEDVKKPVLAISNTNFGDTYNTFIQKQSSINKKLENSLRNSNIKTLVESPKTYKRKVSTLQQETDKMDPFDKLLLSDDEEKSKKIKRVSVDSVGKSPVTKISTKVSNNTNDGTNKIISMLEKNTGLSVKSNISPGNCNKIQSITRKTVTEIPKTQSPKVLTPKLEKVQSPIIQSNKTQIRNAIDSPIMQKRALINASPLSQKVRNKQANVTNQNDNLSVNKNSSPKSYQNKTKMVDKKDLINKNNLSKKDFLSDEEQMDSELEDHDMTSMPQWPGFPGDDDDDDDEDEEKPSIPPPAQQRKQEAISKTAEPMKTKHGGRSDVMDDDDSTDFDSDDMDDSDFDDMSASETEDMFKDMFTIDLRDERAAEYLPLLGAKAQEILLREKRSLLQKLATIRQGLKSLQDNAKKNLSDIEMSKLKIIELNTLIRQP